MSDDIRICAITGNRCGTDTWVIGDCCRCDGCVRFMVSQASDAVRIVAEVAGERDKAKARISTLEADLSAAQRERDQLRDALEAACQNFEDLLLVATKDEDAEGYVTAYHFKTGAIHRMLGRVRQRYDAPLSYGGRAASPPAVLVAPTPPAPYCHLAASEIPGFGTNRDKHRCAKMHRDKPLPVPGHLTMGAPPTVPEAVAAMTAQLPGAVQGEQGTCEMCMGEGRLDPVDGLFRNYEAMQAALSCAECQGSGTRARTPVNPEGR